MINEDDKFVVATLLVSILKLLVDLIVSEGATTEFISDLKRRLIYELSMANSFKAETNLLLSFDVTSNFSHNFSIVCDNPEPFKSLTGPLLCDPRSAINHKIW
jgi:hypothetical protein